MIMITIFSNKINTLNQNNYDKFINSLDISALSCSCGHAACLVRHAYYRRSLKSNDICTVTLLILRVKCSICGRTHAIVPADIVPYSQITLQDQADIIISHLNSRSQKELMNKKPLIDENSIRHVLYNYTKFWKQRLFAFQIDVTDNVFSIARKCLMHFGRQFMQIKCITNIFYCCNHIT